MVAKNQKEFSFFYTLGSSEDPIIQKEMDKQDAIIINRYKNPTFWKIILQAMLVFVLPICIVVGLVSVLNKNTDVPVPVEAMVKVPAYAPNIFITKEQLEAVRNADSRRIDTNLDTSPTPADLAQQKAIKKIGELAGVVETYAPKLMEPR